MKRLRFTEEQIIAVLREQEAGIKTAEVCIKVRPRSSVGAFVKSDRALARDVIPLGQTVKRLAGDDSRATCRLPSMLCQQ